DFNGDGKPDLVVGVDGFHGGRSRTSILLGRGDGGFDPAKEVLASSTAGLAAADLDGNGDQDLAVGIINNGSFLQVLIGEGDGTFTKRPMTSFNANAGHVVAEDLDGDGDVDLVVWSDWADGITVFRNQGTGSFAIAILKAPRFDRDPYFVVAADLDNDGDIDLLTLDDLAPGLLLLRNDGHGTLVAEPG